MSAGDRKTPGGPKPPSEFENLVEEASGGSLPPDPELEKALQEAADAIPERPRKRRAAPAPDPSSAELDGAKPDGVAPDAAQAPANEVALLKKDLTDSGERLLRLQADFENFRKRASRERQELEQYGGQNLVKDLLSVVDNLDRAVDHARQSGGGDLQSLLQGVELVQREFLAVLAKHHIHEIEADNKPFDPNLHEAMAQHATDEVPPNTVVSVFQKGYQLHDRLVRPARVVVAKASEGSKDGGAN